LQVTSAREVSLHWQLMVLVFMGPSALFAMVQEELVVCSERSPELAKK
jgi:hypothetical protein